MGPTTARTVCLGGGQRLGERAVEHAQPGRTADGDAAGRAGRVVGGGEEQAEGGGGVDPLVGAEHGSSRRSPIRRRGDGPPRVGVPVRRVGAGGDADAGTDQRPAAPQACVLVDRDIGQVPVAAVAHERRLGHDDQAELPQPGEQLRRDHRPVLDAVAVADPGHVPRRQRQHERDEAGAVHGRRATAVVGGADGGRQHVELGQSVVADDELDRAPRQR